MKFGLQMFPTDYAIQPPELGKAAEDLGFESLFFPEHTHIPTSRRTPWPGGAELPKQYSHTHDPFVALGAVAAVTKTLLIGTGICLVMQRDPIVLAKEVASVDFLSGGRFQFGIGGGWNEDEMNNHGTKYSLRWKIMRERVLAMREIWTNDEAEYHGEFVDFDPVWSWPKPAQNRIPVLIGGNGARTFDRILEYGDEWMPIGGRTDDLEDRMAELQRRAKDEGRNRIPVSIFGVPENAKVVEQWQKAGVDRCIFTLPDADADTVLPLLKRLAKVARQFG